MSPSDYPSYSLDSNLAHTQSMKWKDHESANGAMIIFNASDGSIDDGVGVMYKDGNNPPKWELHNRDTGNVLDTFSKEVTDDVWYNIGTVLNDDGSVDVALFEDGNQFGTLNTSSSIASGNDETIGYLLNTQGGGGEVHFDSENDLLGV